MADVDLHLHTTASDGRLTPSQLIDLVAERGLRVISVTDHDTTNGLPEALECASHYPRLRVIPGIELSTDMNDSEVHILGYFIDPYDQGLQETLARYRTGRVDRARQMVQKLCDLGLPVEWERVLELAGDGSVGRPHIALAMVEKGYIARPEEAFTTYLGHNGLAYAEREKLPPQESVQMIKEAGGVAVLAHPDYIPRPEPVIEELLDYGIVGMEVYYAQYSAEVIARLAQMAQRYGLLPCGGSDYHGLGNLHEPLPGEKGPPLQVVDQLEQLAIAGRSSAANG